MRRLSVVLILAFLMAACTKKETPVASSPAAAEFPSTPAATAAPPPAPAPAAASSEGAPSLVSFAAGALLAQSPPEYGSSWPAMAVIDEYPDTGWASPKNVVSPQTFVIELPEKTVLDRLEFDTSKTDGEKRGVKDVAVEVSDTSASAGFQTIAEVSLADRLDRQSFLVAAAVPGRWLRLTVKNNHGAPDYLELMDFRGYGKQLTTTPFADASGTYKTNFGLFHLKQEGTSVVGCYEHDGGLLTGGIERRVMKFTWRENGGPDDQGPALMVFTPDGKGMLGLWGGKGSEKLTGVWDGKKVSSEVGSCPNWSSKGGAEARIEDELSKLGRTRLYGINFDTDSDVIRDESKPTLDKVAAVLKSNLVWKLSIEGHTDATGGEAHNQDLSARRAASVRSYLVAGGIDAGRLTARGMGAGVPLASNDTPIGRAQNRRVELVKE